MSKPASNSNNDQKDAIKLPIYLSKQDGTRSQLMIKEEPILAVSDEDDDSFMDWETRNEQIPIGKHIIAGKYRHLFDKHINNLSNFVI